MHLAGDLGIAVEIAAADAHTDSFGQDWEVSSERNGYDSYEGRQIGNKRKAKEITR